MLRPCRNRFIAFAALAAVLVAGPGASGTLAQTGLSPRDLATVRINIAILLGHEPQLPLPVRQRREALLAYYGEEGGRLLWLGTDRPRQLVDRLADAIQDGLRDGDYPVRHLARLEQVIDAADLPSLAVIELHFSAAFLEYASDIQVGRFLPNKIDPNFFLHPREIDQVAALRGLNAAASLDDFLHGWQPQAPAYEALRGELADYMALAEHGGWPRVPLGETLKPGMSSERVPLLRARLAFADEAAPEAPAGQELVYDEALAASVRRFQTRHGLDADGVVGPATVVALNVPLEERIQSIIVAMERWRWMPEDLGEHYLFVNIAGFELRRIREDRIEEKMPVVVGKPYHRTPVFSDQIRYLEFNPYWNVPASIAVNEELPKLRANPAALAANGFEAVRGNEVIDVRAIDWSQYGAGNFPFQLRQRPGENNALGRVKFMFPNPHNVYLHDTPSRGLFARSARAFSHGCIRLARPLDLAEQVLAAGDVEGWSSGRIDQVVRGRERTVVNLREPVPVHITYLTAWVDDGVAQFRSDIYEHDQKLLAALEGKRLAW